MIFKNLYQNAYVTRDLDKAVALFKREYGVAEFIHFEPDMEVITPSGPAHLRCRAALGWVDEHFQIEVIQPLDGGIDVYSSFLPDDDSPRFHHVAMRCDDWRRMRADIDARGWVVAYEGHMEGLSFIYVDARDNVGHYLEYVWATPDMWRAIGAQ